MTSLYNRRLQDIAIFMFKVKPFKSIPANIIDLFSISSSSYNLRNSDFLIPRFNTVHCGKHSLTDTSDHFLWSQLSNKDRVQVSLSAFKTSIGKKTNACQTEPAPACFKVTKVIDGFFLSLFRDVLCGHITESCRL